MASNKKLFQWKRQTDALDVARGISKPLQDSSIKGWMQKIHSASEDAAREAFGGDIFDDSRMDYIPDDESIFEAQQLLDGWLKEKSEENTQCELEFHNEGWNKETKRVMQRHNSHYLEILHDSEIRDKANAYAQEVSIDDIDDDTLVSEVLAGMLNKDIASGIDLGLAPLRKKIKDPTPKMDIRHKQVKERSQARRVKVHAKQSKKEIKKKAQERIQEEEKGRILEKEREEKAIQEEMVQIREELEKEKIKKEEESRRKERIFEEAKRQMQTELRRKKKEEDSRRIHREIELEQRKAKREIQTQQQTIFQMKINMQVLHKHFAGWYNLVLERRVTMGKARAVADWKCKLRAWNAWKAYVACVKSNAEAKAIEQRMKENYRKEQMAIKFWHSKLLKVCLCSWLKYTRHKIERKMLMLEHDRKAKKMEMFMKAAQFSRQQQHQLSSTKQDIDESVILPSSTHQHVRDERGEKMTCRTNGGVKLQDHEMTHIDPRKADGRKNEPVKQDTHQIEDTSRSRMTRNIRLGFVIPATKIEQRKRPSQQTTKDCLPINTWDLTKTTTSTTITELGTQKSHLNNNHQEEFNPGHPLSSGRSTDEPADERTRRPVSVTTPRVRSDRPTTRPIHLAMEERDQQRKERRVLIETEKRRKEEAKLKILREKQEERLKIEEEEKEERIRKKREEKRLQLEVVQSGLFFAGFAFFSYVSCERANHIIYPHVVTGLNWIDENSLN